MSHRMLCSDLYLFQSTLNLHPLRPRDGGIGQTVPSVSTATHIYSLFVEEAESLSHHLDSVICQG